MKALVKRSPGEGGPLVKRGPGERGSLVKRGPGEGVSLVKCVMIFISCCGKTIINIYSCDNGLL